MFRSGLSVFLGCLVLAVQPQSVLGADYSDDLRGSYDWTEPDQFEDLLDFEVGLRYVYSRGDHDMTLAGETYSADDTSHILEGFLRINDHSTDTFVKARLGYSMAVDSTYDTPATLNTEVSASRGRVAYSGVDLGYVPFEGFGGLIGYSYMNESPYMGRISYTTESGGDSEENDLAIHALKLGATGTHDFGPFTIDVEAALVPYAWLNGVYGGYYMAPFTSGSTNYVQGSAGTLDGSLYGASGEVTFGYDATDNLSINFGGRASYLTGDATMTFTAREDGNSSNAQNYIGRTTNLSFVRYGVFGGISGKF